MLIRSRFWKGYADVLSLGNTVLPASVRGATDQKTNTDVFTHMSASPWSLSCVCSVIWPAHAQHMLEGSDPFHPTMWLALCGSHATHKADVSSRSKKQYVRSFWTTCELKQVTENSGSLLRCSLDVYSTTFYFVTDQTDCENSYNLFQAKFVIP
jgi:hypothetical protein